MKMEGLPTSKADLLTNFGKLVKKGHFTKDEYESIKTTFNGLKKASSKEEVEKFRRESSTIRKKLTRHVQRERGKEIDRARVRIKYGEKYGEVYILEDQAFIVGDIDEKTKMVSKAKINPNGSLGKVQSSSLEELDKFLFTAKIPKSVYIKEALFEDLRKIYGNDVEILVTS